MHSFDILLVLCDSGFQCCSDKQAIDCLRQAGWVVEGGIEVFYTSGMQVRVHGVATSSSVRHATKHGGTLSRLLLLCQWIFQGTCIAQRSPPE
jgi:hypothetical protein